MKKLTAGMVCLFMIALVFNSCAPKEKTPAAGTAETSDMLNMLPVEAQGVFFFNAKEMMAIEAVDEAIQKDENYQKYLDFVQATGIDPQKDIYYVAAAMIPGDEETSQKGVGIVNLKYDPDSLLALIKEKSQEEGTPITETDYTGHAIYIMESEDQDNDGVFSFLDASNIAVGHEVGVKSVIDVVKNDKDNVYKNPSLNDLLGKTPKGTIFWGAMMIPSKAVADAASQNPMLQSLSSVQAVTMNFDYKNQNISVLIKMMSTDSEKNTQIAESLTGIKSFGRMAAQENPAIGELLDKINIQSNQEMVEISADIPEELINKLRATAAAESEEQK
jgi:hypothetical protein